MSTVLLFYALGMSIGIAVLGTMVMFLLDVPEEGEEVVPWAELDAEGVTEEEVEAKIKAGFRREKLYGVDGYKYALAFPSVLRRQFVELFFPCFLSALVMVYVTKYFG